MLKKVLLFICLTSLGMISVAQPKVGISLSGGCALGFAHRGALKALEAHGIEPVALSGASMGALVGILFANGLTSDQIVEVIRQEHMDHANRILTPSSKAHGLGLISHKNVYKILETHVAHNNFDSLKMYYACSVTNLTKESCEIIDKGNHLHDYVIASTSIPVVFEAMRIGDCVYVDGGLKNNMPADAIRNKCDILIGINVVPDSEKGPESFDHILDIAEHSLHLIINSGTLESIKSCDHVITPNTDHEYNAFSFKNFDELYQRGYDAMNAYIEAHPEMFQMPNSENKDKKSKKK